MAYSFGPSVSAALAPFDAALGSRDALLKPRPRAGATIVFDAVAACCGVRDWLRGARGCMRGGYQRRGTYMYPVVSGGLWARPERHGYDAGNLGDTASIAWGCRPPHSLAAWAPCIVAAADAAVVGDCSHTLRTLAVAMHVLARAGLDDEINVRCRQCGRLRRRRTDGATPNGYAEAVGAGDGWIWVFVVGRNILIHCSTVRLLLLYELVQYSCIAV